MRRNLLIVILLLLFIFGCKERGSLASGQQTPTLEGSQEKFLIYDDPIYKIKLDYPSNWKPVEQEQTIVAFISPQKNLDDVFKENVNLVMNDLSLQNTTLEEYSGLLETQLKQIYPDMEIVEYGSTILSNNRAQKIVYTVTVGTNSLKVLQIFTIKDQLLYVLTFTAEKSSYAEYLGSVQKMIDSFGITGDPRISETTVESVEDEKKTIVAQSATNEMVSGKWRVYSEKIFYDIGGSGGFGINSGRDLELQNNGKWKFGDSQGTYSLADITPEDWSQWQIGSYGPTQKITLNNWNKGVADGPIEESEERVDFVWVIYHVEPPLVQNAGTVWIKFGR